MASMASAASMARPPPPSGGGARVLRLEGGVQFRVPSKTLLAEQLQYIKEVHAAVLRSSLMSRLKPTPPPSLARSAAANVAASKSPTNVLKHEPLPPVPPAGPDSVVAAAAALPGVPASAPVAAAGAPAAAAVGGAAAAVGAQMPPKPAAPKQTAKRVFLQVLEIPPTCTTTDVLLAYFLALRAHPTARCRLQRLVICVRSVGDLRLAAQCLQRALQSQPTAYTTTTTDGRQEVLRTLLVEQVDELDDVAYDCERAAVLAGRPVHTGVGAVSAAAASASSSGSGGGGGAGGRGAEDEGEGDAGWRPAAAGVMTEAILAEAGAVVTDAHVHAWAARLRLSPAAVLAYAAERSQLAVVTQRCLFDLRGVVRRRTPLLQRALLVFDNAHSLLDLGKRVCKYDVSIVVLDAAIGSLEFLRARQMLFRDAQRAAVSAATETTHASASSTTGFGAGFRRADGLLEQLPLPPAGWFEREEATFPGEIRRAEHFWDFLVSCVDFLRRHSEVGAAAMAVAAKLGGRDRSTQGRFYARNGAGGSGSSSSSGGGAAAAAAAASAALTEEVKATMAKEMDWRQPAQWVVELERALNVPAVGRVLARVLERLELQRAALRLDAAEAAQLAPLEQVCRFLVALVACDRESTRIIVSNAAPVVVSPDYRVQMFAKGSKTSKPTKRLTLTALAPAPMLREVLRAAQRTAPPVSSGSSSSGGGGGGGGGGDGGDAAAARPPPLCVICNTPLYLPEELLPTVLFEHGPTVLAPDAADAAAAGGVAAVAANAAANAAGGGAAADAGSGSSGAGAPGGAYDDVEVRTTRLVVESPMQSKIFALNRGDDQEMLDNSLPELQPFRNYGQLIRDASKVFADGMVVVFRSFRDLHECLSTWQNFNLENSELGMLQPIYADKVIFFESELELENHDTMRKYRQACDTGRGGLLFVTRDGSIRNNHHFWGHYCRALIVLGFPDFKPGVRTDTFEDLEFQNRMTYWKYKYGMITEAPPELDRHGDKMQSFSVLESMGSIVDWMCRVVANPSDYTACIVADRRYTKCLAVPQIQDKPWALWFDRQVDRMCLKIPPTTCRCLDRAKDFIATCYTSSRERRRGVTRLSMQQRRRRRRQGLPRSRAEILDDAYLASRGLVGHGAPPGATALALAGKKSGVDVLAMTLQDMYDTMHLEVQRSDVAAEGSLLSEPLSDEESLSAGEEEDLDATAEAAAAAAVAAAKEQAVATGGTAAMHGNGAANDNGNGNGNGSGGGGGTGNGAIGAIVVKTELPVKREPVREGGSGGGGGGGGGGAAADRPAEKRIKLEPMGS